MQILGPYGLINNWLKGVGLTSKSIAFFGNNAFFRSLTVVSAGWKEVGWNAIIYIAAITGINPQLYEAAKIDGATKMQQAINITIPSITGTIVLLFILRIGAILDAGFDQIFNMYSYAVYEKGDILSTLVYRLGLESQQYSFATAVGLFNSVVALILVLGGNFITRKTMDKGLW
ncbi:ABC transporter permease subunit [Haploplasma modicum]|uniref:ABC transporter permease subunit n=1 Tax=Haploplasma modicum TaxID=2150 RepID=UPI001E3049E0|nr:ABC transporter permease subunit [Haploplasma modicum]